MPIRTKTSKHGKPAYELKMATERGRFEDEGWWAQRGGCLPKFHGSHVCASPVEYLTERKQIEEAFHYTLGPAQVRTSSMQLSPSTQPLAIHDRERNRRVPGLKGQLVIGSINPSFGATNPSKPNTEESKDKPKKFMICVGVAKLAGKPGNSSSK